MAPSFPYAFYACPCCEYNDAANGHGSSDETTDEHTLNPHDTRSAYALYTLNHLLFCDDCNQIRCSKCVSDEIINWFCPSCLFEVPSSVVRSDGNRCSRSCYNCPICTSPVIVTSLASSDDGLLKPGENAGEESYILACQYCNWTTLDVGVRLNRPTKITEQLDKARKARTSRPNDNMSLEKGSDREMQPMSHDERFDKLTAYYREQLSESGDMQNPLSNNAYGSPANLARIINLYGGLSHNALRKTQERPRPMREAIDNEGLSTYTADNSINDDDEALNKMRKLGWEGTTSESQTVSAPRNFEAKFTDELWPVAMHLRIKRGKRCRQCRQFIVRPDSKITSTRYRIRITALSNIPRLSLRSLQSTRPPVSQSFILRSDQIPGETLLQPYVPQQYILTLRNPIFETVKVTLATSAVTPGKVSSKVTILCPSFTIGPAGDVWEDALSNSTVSAAPSDGGRQAAMASLTGRAETDRQPEAGKIWEQTRNSTSVIVEVVPGALKPAPSIVPSGQEELKVQDIGEDDDILEIPIYVRAEWMAEVAGEGEQKGKQEKEARELAYWCVLGVGRIAA